MQQNIVIASPQAKIMRTNPAANAVAREIANLFKGSGWFLGFNIYSIAPDGAWRAKKMDNLLRSNPEKTLGFAAYVLNGVIEKGYFDNEKINAYFRDYGGNDTSNPIFVCRAACYLIDWGRYYINTAPRTIKRSDQKPLKEYLTDCFLPLLRFIARSPCDEMGPLRIATALLHHKQIYFDKVGTEALQYAVELSEKNWRNREAIEKFQAAISQYKGPQQPIRSGKVPTTQPPPAPPH